MTDDPTPDGSELEGAMTADELLARFASRRNTFTSRGTDNDRSQWDRLRVQFRDVSQRSRSLFSDPRLKYPEWAGLFRAAVDVLKVSKVVYSELQAVQPAAAHSFEPAALAELLSFNVAGLTQLDRRLQYLDRIEGYVEGLKLALHELSHDLQPQPFRLQNLARRLILDTRQTSRDLFLPYAHGTHLGSHVGRLTAPQDGSIYARGIQVATLCAAAVDECWPWSDRIELVTIAALLHDCGLLPLTARFRMSAGELSGREPAQYRCHPGVGAALSAGLHEYSIDLPLLIGEHHERLDGTGYPLRLRGHQLSPLSRLMATACRFTELLGECRAQPETAFDSRWLYDVVERTSARLFREAEQGEWDMGWTRRLLETFARIPSDAAQHAAEAASGPWSGDRRSWRRDRSHQRVAAGPAHGQPQTHTSAPAGTSSGSGALGATDTSGGAGWGA